MIGFNPAIFRNDFPALTQSGVYLDSATTALKPKPVIDAISQYYTGANGNVHRSHHARAQKVTAQFEQVRSAVAELLNAEDPRSIVWTRGTTEAINLVSQSYARPSLQPDDEVIVSEIEHHANLIPWLIVAQQTGARIVKLPIGADTLPNLKLLPRLITPRTRLLALSQMSNVTGGQPELAKAIALAHQAGAVVMIDGAQGIVHSVPDMQALDIDFYAFSGHKLFGPNGIGALYGKIDLLESMPPWHGGGKMMKTVSFDGFTPQAIPQRFEAGTPAIAEVLGLGAALKWMQGYDRAAAERYGQGLAQLAEQKLARFPGFRSLRSHNATILSFTLADVYSDDLATLLAEQQIAVRAGYHCAQPLLAELGVNGAVRASFAPYNSKNDVTELVTAVGNALDLLLD
ncbi:MAG: cysteine desulfurase CsdA [Candidatus Malihini olakiniferum]